MDIRQFFVKSDNLLVPKELKGTQVLDIPKNGTLSDLYATIRSRYKLPDSCSFQLWTGLMSMKGKRFDDKGESIDSNIENVLIRIVTKSPTHNSTFNPHVHHRPTLPYDELEISLSSPKYT